MTAKKKIPYGQIIPEVPCGCWLVSPAKEGLTSCQSLFQPLPLGPYLLIQTKTSESNAKQSRPLNTTAFVPCPLLYLSSAGLVLEENSLMHVLLNLLISSLSISHSLFSWISKLCVLSWLKWAGSWIY